MALPDEVAVQLFRIAQSALGNVVRHAQASRAGLSLAIDGNELRLIVEDDGVGFDAERGGEGRSMGLMGMRERAGLLGGTFTIDSTPGRGTRLTVVVPKEGRQ